MIEQPRQDRVIEAVTVGGADRRPILGFRSCYPESSDRAHRDWRVMIEAVAEYGSVAWSHECRVCSQRGTRRGQSRRDGVFADPEGPDRGADFAGRVGNHRFGDAERQLRVWSLADRADDAHAVIRDFDSAASEVLVLQRSRRPHGCQTPQK
ncbi:hypothetical protein ACWEKR_18325 [Nocardia sp. NPDC004573]